MIIAVEGCTHGELEKTYETIAELEKSSGQKVDLLLCCGDFQATRNLTDLQCMAVPDKYKEMGSFYKYYSGEKTAPVLTIFIGGNHEASNHLQELPYGGWVAPNIYFMGYANVVTVNGIRIGGLSGIFKGQDYLLGHHEIVPYNPSTIRSVYHIRNLETFRLKQLSQNPPDIMLSHDWPRGIHKHGDVEELLRRKRFFAEDIQKDQLGSRPTMEILETLRPKYWFSAHLHVKFAAIVNHKNEDESSAESLTRFLALDKCLPKRRFLQIFEIGKKVEEGVNLTLEFDATWLAILRSTNHLLSVERGTNHMPGPLCKERHDFAPSEEEIKEVQDILGQDNSIEKIQTFVRDVPVFNPDSKESGKKTLYPRKNKQTETFCKTFCVTDPCDAILKGVWPQDQSSNEIALDDDEDDQDDDEEEEAAANAGQFDASRGDDLKNCSFPTFRESSRLEDEDKNTSSAGSHFVIDAAPEKANLDEASPAPKKLKRRNQAIYQSEDID